MLYNGIDLTPYFRIKTIYGRGLLDRVINGVTSSGMDGEHVSSVETPPKYIEVVIRITSDDLRATIDDLNNILATKEPVPIIFPDEPDKTYYGMAEYSHQDGRELLHLGRHDATFFIRLSDPFKYGEEKTDYFTDTLIVDNPGTKEADPIVELTVKEPVTFAMISNGDEYNLVGTPADDDIVAVDTRESVLYENGSTIDEWTHTENRDMISDDSNIDSLDGVMGTDGAGIRLASGATPRNRQRGAAVFKELENSVQDFEIESTFDIISRRDIENFRMMIYFLDENMQNIGHMGVKDNSRNHKRRVPLSQLGRHSGGGTGANTVSLLGDSSPQMQPARDTTLMYLRFKREGQKFTVYIAHWRNQRHETVWQETYNDVDNRFQGRLKYVTLFIGSYQDRVTPNRYRINSVEVFELKSYEEDQTPYIARPGDVILFDHKNADVLLNGEDFSREKQFGGEFFKLPKGRSELTMLPADAFDGKLIYRPRYR